MTFKYQFNILMVASTIILGLAIFDTILAEKNRENKVDLVQRQQFVQQTAPLETLFRDLIKSLAEIAIKNDDKQIIKLLADHGINVTPTVASSSELPTPAKKIGK